MFLEIFFVEAVLVKSSKKEIMSGLSCFFSCVRDEQIDRLQKICISENFRSSGFACFSFIRNCLAWWHFVQCFFQRALISMNQRKPTMPMKKPNFSGNKTIIWFMVSTFESRWYRQVFSKFDPF